MADRQAKRFNRVCVLQESLLCAVDIDNTDRTPSGGPESPIRPGVLSTALWPPCHRVQVTTDWIRPARGLRAGQPPGLAVIAVRSVSPRMTRALSRVRCPWRADVSADALKARLLSDRATWLIRGIVSVAAANLVSSVGHGAEALPLWERLPAVGSRHRPATGRKDASIWHASSAWST